MSTRGRATVSRLVRRHGAGLTVTLRRAHSLQDGVAGKGLTALELDGDHLAGATSLNLRATRVQGRLVAGIRLTIAGQQLEVAGDVEALNNELVAVPVAAALEAPASGGTAVAVEPYRDYVFLSAALVRRESGGQDGTLARGGAQDLLLPALGAPTTPRRTDKLVVNGIPGETAEVEPLQPGSAAAGWIVRRSGRAA